MKYFLGLVAALALALSGASAQPLRTQTVNVADISALEAATWATGVAPPVVIIGDASEGGVFNRIADGASADGVDVIATASGRKYQRQLLPAAIPNARPCAQIDLASGVATPLCATHVLGAESGTEDDLTDIDASAFVVGGSGKFVIAEGDTITVKTSGNISTPDGAEIVAEAGGVLEWVKTAADAYVIGRLVSGVPAATGRSVRIEDYKLPDEGWHEALDRAYADLASSGGAILLKGGETYAFTGVPTTFLPPGVFVSGDGGRAKITVASTTAGRLFEAWGSGTGGFTVTASTATAANVLPMTSVSGLEVGQLLWVRIFQSNQVLMKTQIVRIYSISGNNVTLTERLAFPIDSAEEYSITRIIPHKSGGITNLHIDCASWNATQAQAIYYRYTDGFYVDNILGENCNSNDPGNSNNPGGEVLYDHVNYAPYVGTVLARNSGGGAAQSIHVRHTSRGYYHNIDIEDSNGFGAGWYYGAFNQIDTVRATKTRFRGVKIQNEMHTNVGSAYIDGHTFTGLSFERSTKSFVGTAVIGQFQPRTYAISSVTRASNVVTVVTAEPYWLYNGHTGTIAGVTDSSFNGVTSGITRVNATTFTFAQAGSNASSSGGTFTSATSANASLWVEELADVHIDRVYLRGTEPLATRDIQVDATGYLSIGELVTEWGTAPSTLENGKLYIRRLNRFDRPIDVQAGNAVPFRFYADNFNYGQIRGNAATSGQVGIEIVVNDSGGNVARNRWYSAGGTQRFQVDAGFEIQFWRDGASFLRMGTGGLTPSVDNAYDLGSASLSFKNIYAHAYLDENGDPISGGGSLNIPGLTAKTTPTGSDLLVIADVADSNALKKVEIGNLPEPIFERPNFEYLTLTGTAATSGTTGFEVTVKDSGGADKPVRFYNASGNARVDMQASQTFSLWQGGASSVQLSSSGHWVSTTDGAKNLGGTSNQWNNLYLSGGVFVDTIQRVANDGGYVFPSYTAAQVADSTHAVNTSGKVVGKAVFDTTNTRLMIATGTGATDNWAVADGSATVTPSP